MSLPSPAPPLPGNRRLLPWLFCACVVMLAIFQFSENTADPDLWAHTLFGRHWLQTGHLEFTDTYSWTAAGQPWINHEVLAEAALGWAHQIAGGMGLWLLKVVVGLLSWSWAVRLGGAGLTGAARTVVWVVAAVAVVEISFGFAARPQIFTALALVLELWLLRKVGQGRLAWAVALPVLFGLWINTHGGVVAGGVVLFVAVVAMTAQSVAQRSTTQPVWRHLGVAWLAGAASAAALLANPWGWRLIQWLIGSVLWLRPEIDEWNPTAFGWDHAALYILLGLMVVAYGWSRRPKVWWELAVCVVLALLAVRSVRNTPLFALAALAFIPEHFADVLARYRQHFERLANLMTIPSFCQALAMMLALLIPAIGVATFTLHKDHPLTMEVPRGQYPVGAVQFLQQHGMHGNLLTFFDWGEMCLWELPESKVSMDGRLDTCYSRELIREHWHLYNDEPVDATVLDINRADVALLPVHLLGSVALAKKHGWQPVYLDAVAVVLVRDLKTFPQLTTLTLPVQGAPEATFGRAAFPDALRTH